jgi:uncharacterized membrane protein YfcA
VGIGGGFIILGVLSVLLPITTLVPVLAAILASIDLTRAIVFRAHLYKPIFYPFSIGSFFGVVTGTALFISLPEKVIGTGLVVLILMTLLFPLGKRFNSLKQPFIWIGIVHSFLSTIFGYGGLFQSAILRTKLSNLQLTATLATSFLLLELLKISFYVIHGFNYSPYISIIITSACGAIPASLLGRKFAGKIGQKFYRTSQKVIIGIIVISILIKVWG